MAERTRYEAYLTELAEAKEAARQGTLSDIAAVKGLVGAMGQSFTTTLFALQQVNTLKSDVDFLMSLVRTCDEPWVRTVMSALLRRPLRTLRNRYHLHRTADLHEKASDLIPALTGDQLLNLTRGLVEYHNFLSRSLRMLLPFYELSLVFEGHRALTGAPDTATTHGG